MTKRLLPIRHKGKDKRLCLVLTVGQAMRNVARPSYDSNLFALKLGSSTASRVIHQTQLQARDEPTCFVSSFD